MLLPLRWRTLDYGFISVFLGVYLTLLDFSALQAGLVFSAIMAGSALSNMLASWKGDTIGRKRMFIAMSLLMVAGGVGLLDFLRHCGSDVGRRVRGDDFRGRRPHGLYITGYCQCWQKLPRRRSATVVFSWYNLVTIFTRSLGALLIALPVLFQQWTDIGELASFKLMFVIYTVIAAGAILLYVRLSPRIEVQGKAVSASRESVPDGAPSARGVIWKMTGLSALDALGGGFAVRSFVSFWFVNRFGVDLLGISGIFFAAQLLNVVSVALAAPVAARIGLVNTMAFTQVAANLMFIGMAFSFMCGWRWRFSAARDMQ